MSYLSRVVYVLPVERGVCLTCLERCMYYLFREERCMSYLFRVVYVLPYERGVCLTCLERCMYYLLREVYVSPV